MIALAIMLHALWIMTLFCAGYGMGWVLVNFVREFNLPIFAAVGLSVFYIIVTAFLGHEVGNVIEHLTGY